MKEELLGFVDAAKAADMQPQNFNYYLKIKKSPPFKEVAGRKVFKRDDVIRWAAELKKSKDRHII